MVDSPTARVAIVVRTKNRPTMLRRALSSIAAQSFTQWETIVVNDGGDAAEVERVIGEIATPAEASIRPLHMPESVGRWPAANAGVAASTAPLLVLHDDDDSWHPHFLARTVAHLDAHELDHGVAARIEVILEEERGGVMTEFHRYLLEAHNEEILLTDLLEFNRFVPIGFLYRRELHTLIGPYNESLPAAGDWAFNLAVVALGPVRYVSDEALAYWHQRPSMTGTLGNSVHVATGDHSIADRTFRDQALRDFVQRSGLGLPLYLSTASTDMMRKLESLADAIARLEARATHLEHQNDLLLHNQSRTIDTRVRGWFVRQRSRFRAKR